MTPNEHARDARDGDSKVTATRACLRGLFEDMLGRVETRPWWALYRLAIGFWLVPVFARYRGADGSDWRLVPFFVFVLLSLRLVPAAVRRLVPFSDALQARWFRQRLLGKRFDSYQWRKLFWFGLGVTAHAMFFEWVGTAEISLAGACLLFGGLGALTWWLRVRTKEGIDDFAADREARVE